VRVAVLGGGRSSEHEISVRSAAAVAEGLAQAGHEPVAVGIERDGRWVCRGIQVELRPADGLLGCDVAFPVLHGPYGEDGTVQGMLEVLDVPYVGSGVLASAICMDKVTFKRLLAFQGVPQVEFCVAGETEWRQRVTGLGLPLWVKPSRLGSSVGISRVESLDGLDQAVALARDHDPRVLIEASAGGREIECSVIGNTEPMTSVPGEIIPHADWYDYQAKYAEGGMELVAPAPLDGELDGRVRELAARVYALCGCSGLARCDFFLSDGEVLVNELNTIPGFTETSVVATLLAASGIAAPELCDRLVRLAVERHEAERQVRH
jgi:D-alanine-D-alanine ligase